ncbi:hypothetical protein ACS0TY_022565 [Phlomoides rotata]
MDYHITHGRHLKGIMGSYFNFNLVKERKLSCVFALLIHCICFLLQPTSSSSCDEGIDEVKDIFKNFPNILGPLDDKDPEGEDYDDEEDEQAGNVELKLESKLKGLVIK